MQIKKNPQLHLKSSTSFNHKSPLTPLTKLSRINQQLSQYVSITGKQQPIHPSPITLCTAHITYFITYNLFPPGCFSFTPLLQAINLKNHMSVTFSKGRRAATLPLNGLTSGDISRALMAVWVLIFGGNAVFFCTSRSSLP